VSRSSGGVAGQGGTCDGHCGSFGGFDGVHRPCFRIIESPPALLKWFLNSLAVFYYPFLCSYTDSAQVYVFLFYSTAIRSLYRNSGELSVLQLAMVCQMRAQIRTLCSIPSVIAGQSFRYDGGDM
jgi:hypothetical protein